MFSKSVIDSLRENFNERFCVLSKRSIYLKEAITEIQNRPGIKELKGNAADSFEDDLYAVISSASMLGYYIGLQEGADLIHSLTADNLPEKMLEAFGELAPDSSQM